MRILCLDLATSLGWACGGPDRPISHGVIKLPKTGEDIGRFLAAYREWLGHAIEEMAPTEIIFEAPILLGLTSITTLRKLYSLAGVTELVAFDYELPVREANLTDIRKHFIGVTRAPKEIVKERRRQWMKDRIVGECRGRGFDVAGDDDADAIAILSYGISLKHPSFVLQAVTEARAA